MQQLPPNPIRPARCEHCPYKSRTCGTRGPEDSPFVVVGESPGNNEIAKGYPFVGESGIFIESIFESLGLQCEPFIVNAVQCYPVKKDQNNLAQACQACNSNLLGLIRAYPRKVILALGNGAVWSLTGDYSSKITQIRGQHIHSELAINGIIPTVHPAFLLRGGGSTRLFKEDLAYAVNLLHDLGRKEYVDSQHTVLERVDDVRALIDLASRAKFIGSDIETTALNPRAGYILSQGFCFDTDVSKTYIVPPFLFGCLGEIYDPRRVGGKWVWHNGKFDIGWLRHEAKRFGKRTHIEEQALFVDLHTVHIDGPRKGYEYARVDEDTMLLSYALDETKGIHGLEQVASDVIGAPNWKGMLDSYLPKKHSPYSLVPPDILYKYQGKDLSSTLQSFFVLRERVRNDARLEKLYTRTLVPVSDVLTWVEDNGLTANRGQFDENRTLFTARKEAALTRVNELSREAIGQDINPGSWQQVQKVLYVGGFDLADGKVLATDQKTLENLPPHAFKDALLEYRAYAKSLSTYVNGIEELITPDGKIHPSFKIHGTTTGRLACGDPNLLNIDRDKEIRNQFQASEGRTLIEGDLNQAELRVLAELSKDPALCAVYLEGKESIHDIVSRKFFGPVYDYEQKMKAKTVTFGIVYGREAFSLAMTFKITVREAQSYIDAWFDQFPLAKKTLDQFAMAAISGKILQTHFGRLRRFGLVGQDRMHDVMNQAKNFPMQSIASDIMLQAAIEMTPTLKRWDVWMVNLVYDAIMVDCPDREDLKQDVMHLMKTTIEGIAPKWGIKTVPFKAEFKEGKRWGDIFEMKEKELAA